GARDLHAVPTRRSSDLVDERMDGYDTPDMIRRIKERYWLYDGKDYSKTREILIYPDASGDGRRSVNASTTDLQLLKQAGFKVMRSEEHTSELQSRENLV